MKMDRERDERQKVSSRTTVSRPPYKNPNESERRAATERCVVYLTTVLR